MGLRTFLENVSQGAAASVNDAGQTQEPQDSTRAATNNGVMPSSDQADEALRNAASQSQEESPLLQSLREISEATAARRNIRDKAITVELPKPAAEMSQKDYEIAFLRAMLRANGLSDPTDGEILSFQYELKKATGGQFGIRASVEQLREIQGAGNKIQVAVSDWSIAVVDAGKREIFRVRQEQAARAEQLRREAQAYGEDAIVGFYKLQANGLINVVNGATKLVGAPEIPRFEVRGEYWKDKKDVAEAATTVTAGVLTGGAGLAGEVLVIGSSAANMTEAATGEDLRTGEQLSTTDRVLRGATGLAGAYSVRGRVDKITDDVAARMKSGTTGRPTNGAAEAVTPEGVRVPVPSTSSSVDELTTSPLQARARTNGQYAGQKFPINDKVDELITKYPERADELRALVRKYPNGVRFTADGFPDFRPYAIREVKIRMQGNRTTDFSDANRAAGFKETPAGYTWHHHQDRTTMQLIPTDLHNLIRHDGGVSEIKRLGVLEW